MRRVNQHLFYQLGAMVRPLREVEESPLSQHLWTLHNARVWLSFMLTNDLYSFVVCGDSMQDLITAIDAIVLEKTSDFGGIEPDRKLELFQAYRIRNAAAAFETVLAAELPTFDTYIVSKKGIYATADLIEVAERAIDDSARAALSEEAIKDFKQAGKCLAFELPTAAGFHTMRSVEAVLRKYWKLVKKPTEGTKLPEMAQCINELRESGEDAKLMDILDHIRDLHRNTIMHPEAFLTVTEALRLFDIGKSAISAMGDRIIELQKKVAAEDNPLNALGMAASA